MTTSQRDHKPPLPSQTPTTASNADRTVLMVVYSVLALVAVVGGSKIFYELALRDTWVNDNYSSVTHALDELDALLRDNNQTEVIAKYHAVQAMLHGHAIDDPDLAARLTTINSEIAQIERAQLAAQQLKEQADIAAQQLKDQEEIAAIQARQHAAMIDEHNIKDPVERQVFIGARQDYNKYGWNHELLDQTIEAQILFEQDHKANLQRTDHLLMLLEREWRANRTAAGLSPEKLKSEIE